MESFEVTLPGLCNYRRLNRVYIFNRLLSSVLVATMFAAVFVPVLRNEAHLSGWMVFLLVANSALCAAALALTSRVVRRSRREVSADLANGVTANTSASFSYDLKTVRSLPEMVRTVDASGVLASWKISYKRNGAILNLS